MTVLTQRKETYRRRQPGIVNLIAASEISRFLINGMVGRLDLPDALRRERRALARAEVEYFAKLMEDEPMGVQIGIVPDTLPHASFQIFRQPDRHVLALSPFRLGEEPNIRVGVAMITSAPRGFDMATTRTLRVNGKTVTATVDDPATPLLYILRNDAGLHGPRFGCGLGQCGSCTVHVNGEPVRSCMRPLASIGRTR